MRIDEGKIIITKMLDKLRVQFRMKENIRLFYVKTLDLHGKFNLFYSLKTFSLRLSSVILIIFFY